MRLSGGRGRRGFLLIELVVYLAISAMLVVLLSQLVVATMALNSRANEHAARLSVVDGLLDQVQQDALACRAYRRLEDGLELTCCAARGTMVVTYTLTDNAVQRTTDEGGARTWSFHRLRFAWRIEAGAVGDVLHLAFRESKPPNNAALDKIHFAAAALLPGESGGEGAN